MVKPRIQAHFTDNCDTSSLYTRSSRNWQCQNIVQAFHEICPRETQKTFPKLFSVLCLRFIGKKQKQMLKSKGCKCLRNHDSLVFFYFNVTSRVGMSNLWVTYSPAQITLQLLPALCHHSGGSAPLSSQTQAGTHCSQPPTEHRHCLGWNQMWGVQWKMSSKNLWQTSWERRTATTSTEADSLLVSQK